MDPESSEDFYKKYIAELEARAAEIGVETSEQSTNPSWYEQQRLRISVTIVKVIARHWSPDYSPIIKQKSTPQCHPTVAIKYGSEHESGALQAYVQYCQSLDPPREVESCGPAIHHTMPWLSASPDCLVKVCGKVQRELEIKCPCTTRTVSRFKNSLHGHSHVAALKTLSLSSTRIHALITANYMKFGANALAPPPPHTPISCPK